MTRQRRNPKKRFDLIHRICKAINKCEPDEPINDDEDPKEAAKRHGHGGCGNAQPVIRREGLRLVGTIKPSKKEMEDGAQPETSVITPQKALNIFRNISAEDIRKLGLSNDYARPEWMIITVLPVPPPPVRPSIVVDGSGVGMRGEDDLTYKLGDIIRANSNVMRCHQEGSPQHVVTEFESLLQFHVATYMDNNIAGQPQALQKSGRPVKSIRARLKGKEGRLRGNLMGKRVDFSARTVITGDPNLSLDEVGVPRSIARTLTFPETVTPYNIQHLTQLVANGPNEHPGAKYIIRDDGQRIDLRHTKAASGIHLMHGWKVERHIRDGDFIIFNRQPSLHKESMMGHRVRVMPYSTFRLNLSVTSPYNADFDGDEMNLHVPQSEETRAEVMQLCMVPLNIVSPQKNGPLMGIVQDTLAGIYKICRRDVFLDRDQVMNILLWVPDWDGIIPPPSIFKPQALWTGKQIISMILPLGLNLLRGSDEGMSPINDDGLLVHNGELMFGLLSKKVVGASAGGIVHVIYNEKGPEAAVNFFNGAQRVVNYWLLHWGFSIGIGDTIPDQATSDKIKEIVLKQKELVQKIVDQATNDELEPLPGMNIRETFESHVSKYLNEARDKAGGSTEKSLKDLNNAIQMARSGSKGSTINISQMTAVVGQQSVEGKRIPFGFKYRTLPHYSKDDYSPAARGFVENSYLRGLTPGEFFFHAMAGREGLIDTAVKTAETGYIQRRLVKALEDVMAKYDTTVRNSLGDIVQFVYGEDGLDAVYIEKQRIDTIVCTDAQFDKKFKVDVMEGDAVIQDFVEQAGDLMGDVEVQRCFDEEYEALLKDRQFLRYKKTVNDEQFQLPLNIERIIETARTTFRIQSGTKSDLHPKYAIEEVRRLLDKLVIVRGDDPISREAQDSATILFKALVRSQLAYKRLVERHSLNKLAFDNILGEIESRFLRAAVSAGEMVGVLAAQSIGEPATQMTLNTFHFAGVSAKNVTLGVPRLKEILNVATNIKTPSMNVYQRPHRAHDKESCKKLRSVVEHTSLRSVTEATEIYYDPDIQSTVIEADKDMVESYFIIPEDNAIDIESQSKWLLRIILSRRKMLDKGLTVQEVASGIKSHFHGDIAVIFSDNNADEQVIRIRTVESEKAEDTGIEEDFTLKRLEHYMLDSVTLRGIPGVSRAFISEAPRLLPESDGSLKATSQEWYLDTSGTSLKHVLGVWGVDSTRTSCNSFVEVLTVFGIEATRAALLRELTNVLAFDGSYVNHRHLALLVDVMTSRGVLMAITRHGINRAETGALMRCSFEETVEILLEAAAVGELDDCRGISENVMLGQLAPLGTGEFDVQLDPGLLSTVTVDNAQRLGLGQMVQEGPMADAGAATPYAQSPLAETSDYGPDYGASFSPQVHPGGNDDMRGGFSSYGGGFSPYHTDGSGTSYGGIGSPGFGAGQSPFYSPQSPAAGLTSPGYAITSPSFLGGSTSPAYNPSSPAFSPSSPAFSPSSPSYSPSSPSFGVKSTSPTSPRYSPTSPHLSPSSPTYSPTSPLAKSTSPSYSPASPAYSPASPAYTPTSGPKTAKSTSPAYSPTVSVLASRRLVLAIANFTTFSLRNTARQYEYPLCLSPNQPDRS